MKNFSDSRYQGSEFFQVSGNRQIVCQMLPAKSLSNVTCSLQNASDRREIA